jgi:hypothetical protein
MPQLKQSAAGLSSEFQEPTALLNKTLLWNRDLNILKAIKHTECSWDGVSAVTIHSFILPVAIDHSLLQ